MCMRACVPGSSSPTPLRQQIWGARGAGAGGAHGGQPLRARRAAPSLLESTRAACRHTCLCAGRPGARGEGRGAPRNACSPKSELPVQTAEVWRLGPARAVGAPESKLQALGGDGRVGSERRRVSTWRPPGSGSGMCFTATVRKAAL